MNNWNFLTGSLHVNRIMKETPETARVGIRGADTKAIKVFIRQKSTHELNRLERVVLIVGGNNLGKREGGKQVPNHVGSVWWRW